MPRDIFAYSSPASIKVPDNVWCSPRGVHRRCFAHLTRCHSPPSRRNRRPVACSSMRAYPDIVFSTARLLAEPLTAEHWGDLRRMDQNEQFMAYLGGPRDEAGT